MSDLQRDYQDINQTNFFEKNTENELNDLYNECLNNKENLQLEIQSLNIKKFEKESTIGNLEKEKQKVAREKKLLSQHETYSRRFNNLLDKIKDQGIEYTTHLTNELKIKLRNKEDSLEKYKYCFSMIKTYTEIQNHINEECKLVNEYNQLIENYNSELKNIHKESIILVDDFTQGDAASNIEKLLSLVENTQILLSENTEYNDKCPICDSHITNLDNTLEIKLKNLLLKTGEQKQLVENNINKRRNLEERQKDVFGKQKELGMMINRLRINIASRNNTLNDIQNNILFDNNLFSLEFNNLIALLKREEVELKKLKIVLNDSIRIDELREKMFEFENIDLQFNKISVEEIEEIINKEIKGEKDLSESIKTTTFNLSQIQSKASNLQITISKMRELFEKYRTRDLAESGNLILKEIRSAKAKEKYIEELISKTSKIYKLSNDFRVIKGYDEDIFTLNQSSKYLRSKRKILETKIDVINSQYGDKANHFLNSENSPIKKYYQYLNPNPSDFSDLYFQVEDNNKLEVKIKNDRGDLTANHVLSSGQLNVLAISIFIATNTAQTLSYFDFIAIDDPIQNMDDVNRFSITDVISQLEQQVIFSTHDSEYVNLFVKKNENRLDDIAVYYLNSDSNQYKNIINYSTL